MDKNNTDNSGKNFYSNILFVSDLPQGTKNQDLENLFYKYKFIQASLNNSKSNKIWAQVILESEYWATKARHELNGFFLVPKSDNNDKSKGKPIRICKYESNYIFNDDHNNYKNIDYKRNLLIKNLDKKMSQMEFYNIFLKYGDISSGKIEYDQNGVSKGFGYIYYYDENSAEKKKNELNEKEFYGKKIKIVNLIPGKIKKTNNNFTIFILNLPNNITEKEIKSIVDKYGNILSISLTNKGYAFIVYSTYEAASECLSDIKRHPICFSGLPNLVVKFATSKEERQLNKNSNQYLKNNDDINKFLFKYISNEEEIKNIFDLENKIRLFIKMIFVTEYIPSSVEVNERLKSGIVTFNNIKDCEIFANKFKEYCLHRRPMFNCISYNKIKYQINDKFINLDNYQDLNYRNNFNNVQSGNNININNIDINNTSENNLYQFKEMKGDSYFPYNNNQINNCPLPNDDLYNDKYNYKYNYNNLTNYSKINNFYNPKNQSCQFNIYKNNKIYNFNNNINQYNNISSNNNINNIYNNNYNTINNTIYNNSKNNSKQNKMIIPNSENNKMLLACSEFNSAPKCIYNSENQNIENNENIIDISDSIYQIVYEKYPYQAGKITGMIKELGLNKMNLLLSKPDDLNKIIDKAYNMVIEVKDK